MQEEVAQENLQKIEAEKQTVQEAKMELDKLWKKVEDMETKHISVGEQLDQLPDDMEPLKVELCVFRNSLRNQNMLLLFSSFDA